MTCEIIIMHRLYVFFHKYLLLMILKECHEALINISVVIIIKPNIIIFPKGTY